jgi:hypothetical protein
VKQIAASFTTGTLITMLPLVLAHWIQWTGWKSVAAVCAWPIMLALRQGTYLAKPSELNRLAIFYLVNIVTWVFLIESAFLLVRRVNKRTAH